jgi:hypothetical protein
MLQNNREFRGELAILEIKKVLKNRDFEFPRAHFYREREIAPDFVQKVDEKNNLVW